MSQHAGMRIGELARRTGLTVRTLRYYEEIGLFGPADRSPAGQRIYGSADVERLYQVALLRSLGLPLDDVRAGLASNPDDFRLSAVDCFDTCDGLQPGPAAGVTRSVGGLRHASDTERPPFGCRCARAEADV